MIQFQLFNLSLGIKPWELNLKAVDVKHVAPNLIMPSKKHQL